jgi:hydrogenase expression/formation protein HypD
MRFADEFRNREAAVRLRDAIHRSAERIGRPATLMEVCGTHTVAIFRWGLRSLLPESVRLISGPGCPVCVTPNDDIDIAIELSRRDDVILCTFGDMMRVPGSRSSLAGERARGADVRVLYSAAESLRVAERNPDKEVVFFGVGFETTSPTIAATVLAADAAGIDNFSIVSAHKLIPPALRALCSADDVRVDGFLLPGHVSVILGMAPYEFVAREFARPAVIAGFEPTDILQAIRMLVDQLAEGRYEIENAYGRVVATQGNPVARKVLADTFVEADVKWRGFGVIDDSGLALREDLAHRDAVARFKVECPPPVEPQGCMCGSVLRGVVEPAECPLFGRSCTPETPVGACMVSSEGTCAAHYKHGAGTAQAARRK